MRTSFSNYPNLPSYGQMSHQPLSPCSVYPRHFDQFAIQNARAAELSPVVESLVEYRLAEMVMRARLRAQADMANFFSRPEPPVQSPMRATLPQQQQVPFRATPSRGLELLSRATSISHVSEDASEREHQSMSDKSETSSLDDSEKEHSTRQRVYVETIRDTDILCGRGGRSNHHPGNKRYRHVISEMKLSYKKMETKSVKTDLSRTIVDHVCKYGGRFIKKEGTTGRYYVLTRGEARKKTSQALRESKALKWTK